MLQKSARAVSKQNDWTSSTAANGSMGCGTAANGSMGRTSAHTPISHHPYSHATASARLQQPAQIFQLRYKVLLEVAEGRKQLSNVPIHSQFLEIWNDATVFHRRNTRPNLSAAREDVSVELLVGRNGPRTAVTLIRKGLAGLPCDLLNALASEAKPLNCIPWRIRPMAGGDDDAFASILARVEASELAEQCNRVLQREGRAIQRRLCLASEALEALQHVELAVRYLQPEKSCSWVPASLQLQLKAVGALQERLLDGVNAMARNAGLENDEEAEEQQAERPSEDAVGNSRVVPGESGGCANVAATDEAVATSRKWKRPMQEPSGLPVWNVPMPESPRSMEGAATETRSLMLQPHNSAVGQHQSTAGAVSITEALRVLEPTAVKIEIVPDEVTPREPTANGAVKQETRSHQLEPNLAIDEERSTSAVLAGAIQPERIEIVEAVDNPQEEPREAVCLPPPQQPSPCDTVVLNEHVQEKQSERVESPMELEVPETESDESPIELEVPMELDVPETESDESSTELEVVETESDDDIAIYSCLNAATRLQQAEFAAQLAQFPGLVQQLRACLFDRKHSTVADLDGYLFADKRFSATETDDMARALVAAVSVGMRLPFQPPIELALADLLAAIEQFERSLGELPPLLLPGFERILARVGGDALRDYCSSAIEDELRSLQQRMQSCLASVDKALKVQDAVKKLDVPLSSENAATCASIKRKYAQFSADLRRFVEEQKKIEAEALEAGARPTDDGAANAENPTTRTHERVAKLLGKIQHRITRKRNDAWIDKNFTDVQAIAEIVKAKDFGGPDKALRHELVLVLDHLISAVLLSPLTSQATLVQLKSVLGQLAGVHKEIDEYIQYVLARNLRGSSSNTLLAKKRPAYAQQNGTGLSPPVAATDSVNVVDPQAFNGSSDEPRIKRQRVEAAPRSDFLVKVERTAAAVAAAEAAAAGGDGDAVYEVFVTDLPWGTTKEADVASYFGIAGAVVSVQMPTMGDGSTVGVAVVRFVALEGMTLALRMDGYPFNGKNIRVAKAGRNRQERPNVQKITNSMAIDAAVASARASGFKRILVRLDDATRRKYCCRALEEDLQDVKREMRACAAAMAQARQVEDATRKLEANHGRPASANVTALLTELDSLQSRLQSAATALVTDSLHEATQGEDTADKHDKPLVKEEAEEEEDAVKPGVYQEAKALLRQITQCDDPEQLEASLDLAKQFIRLIPETADMVAKKQRWWKNHVQNLVLHLLPWVATHSEKQPKLLRLLKKATAKCPDLEEWARKTEKDMAESTSRLASSAKSKKKRAITLPDDGETALAPVATPSAASSNASSKSSGKGKKAMSVEKARLLLHRCLREVRTLQEKFELGAYDVNLSRMVTIVDSLWPKFEFMEVSALTTALFTLVEVTEKVVHPTKRRDRLVCLEGVLGVILADSTLLNARQKTMIEEYANNCRQSLELLNRSLQQDARPATSSAPSAKANKNKADTSA
ncbi:hypothetical protein BBJ28_00000427 [Nothophytophthora sp. Chile5]|nr:hypothetical protein BBJ28_00000427 [Nothophytophthora sp. Chile5]